MKPCTLIVQLWLASFLYACIGVPAIAVTLPFTDSFESGDFRAWNGGKINGFAVAPARARAGHYAARGTSTPGLPTDYYQDAYFGDHPRAKGAPVTSGLYVKLSHKFDNDFDFGTASRYHKVLLINFEDENDLRREQILLNVFGTSKSNANTGQYVIENIHWNTDRSFGNSRLFQQNRGAPVSYRLGRWDIIKIFILPNTVGQTDGIVRVWINGETKIEHTNISMRKTTYNPNLVIIGFYAPHSDIKGTRWWDDVTVSESDPDIKR